MAVVASTILGLIQNLRAFGGILLVSLGAPLVVAWVGWLCGVQVTCGWPGSALVRRPTAVSDARLGGSLPSREDLGLLLSLLYARVLVVNCPVPHDPWVMYHS